MRGLWGQGKDWRGEVECILLPLLLQVTFYSLILSSEILWNSVTCISAWNEKAGDGEVHSTCPHSRTVHFVTCLSALVEFLWIVRQLSLAHRRLAFSLCFPLIKLSFCLLNCTDLDHSKSLLMGCLYQILAGISLTTLPASPTVLQEICAMFLKAHQIGVGKVAERICKPKIISR